MDQLMQQRVCVYCLEIKGCLYGHCICIILVNSTLYGSILHGLILNYW